jgi:hypothetical protein
MNDAATAYAVLHIPPVGLDVMAAFNVPEQERI